MQNTYESDRTRGGAPRLWCAAAWVCVLLAPAGVGAQQISPNPNPGGSTITVASPNAVNGLGVDFENLGDINIIPGGTLTNNGALISTGVVTNEDLLVNNNVIQNQGLFDNTDTGQVFSTNGTFINYGVVVNNGIIEGSNVAQSFRNEGTWEGIGSQSGLFEDLGDLAPGTDGTTGVLAINGDYAKEGGSLLIDVAGPGGPTGVSHDRVNVSGAWSFSGNTTLDVQLEAGYLPRFEDSFILGSAEAFDGFFSTTLLPMASDPSGFWELEVVVPGGGAPTLALASASPIALSGGPSFLSLMYSTIIGDMNFNGVVDDDDVEFFAMALNNPAAYEGLFTYEPRIAGDLNVDGVFNFSDIEPFVGLLSPSAAAKLQTLIPEPGTATLLLTAVAVFGLRRRD